MATTIGISIAEPVATAPKNSSASSKSTTKIINLSVWPNWRGPTLDGVSSGTGYATSWSQEDNIKWRVQLPGLGASTPAVWGDHIVLTCDIEGHDGPCVSIEQVKNVGDSNLVIFDRET